MTPMPGSLSEIRQKVVCAGLVSWTLDQKSPARAQESNCLSSTQVLKACSDQSQGHGGVAIPATDATDNPDLEALGSLDSESGLVQWRVVLKTLRRTFGSGRLPLRFLTCDSSIQDMSSSFLGRTSAIFAVRTIRRPPPSSLWSLASHVPSVQPFLLPA
jgi:hypothetical protein